MAEQSSEHAGKTWMVVRRTRAIPGGYRVVQHGLTEKQALAAAATYKRPHEAMSWSRLVEIRTAAIQGTRS